MKLPGLIGEARRYRENARAPHSKFKVGAAIETDGGRVYGGCNIENSTYGLTVCAERVAVWKALSEGEANFRRIAVVADTANLTPPCGPCRQILWEYCGDLEVILSNLQGKKAKYRLSDLFPVPFDNRFLDDCTRAQAHETGD
jgi:cytidine deaminase